MNIASIDIGSNTVLLLIANLENGKLNPLLNQYESPRLGKNLIPGGKIEEGRIDQLIKILRNYKNEIQKYNCSKVIVTATNAMRIANNSSEIVKLVKNEVELDISVIDGSEEAKLSFLGASSSLPELENKIVIDIGGGSTEVVFGKGNKIIFKKSFQTGVVSLTEKFLNPFPYSNMSLKDSEIFLSELFYEATLKIEEHIPIIGVAGTPTTLSCIKQNLKEYDEIKVERSQLTYEDLQYMYIELSQLNGDQILNKFGSVTYGRQDVLFAGLLILKNLLNSLKSNIIYVSGRGLRYGNIINYLNKTKAK